MWRDVVGYEGLYQVSNMGRVKSIRAFKFKIIKGISLGHGYLRVSLSKFGCAKNFSIHRLVCMAFLENPFNKPFVNHIDNNPLNNEATNLEWATHSENMKWKFITGYKMPKGFDCKYAKKVYQYSLHGELMKIWGSVKSIEIELGYTTNKICDVCNGKRVTAKGYVWSYTQLDKSFFENKKFDKRALDKSRSQIIV